MKRLVLAIGVGLATTAMYSSSPVNAKPGNSCIGSLGESIGKQACAGKGEPAFLDLMHDDAGPGGSHWPDEQMLGWAREVCAMRDAGKTEAQASGFVQTAMAADGGIHGAESRKLTSWAEYTMCRQYANFG